MINRFLTDINILKNAINTKKLVIFAGAGISVDAGVPNWNDLITEIKKELDLPDSEREFLKIPQIYFNERQEKEYVEKVRKVLKHKKLKHNAIHEEIFELEPEHILTTNFEDLLEQVINKKSLPFSIVKQDVDLPYCHNTKLLVKIHGDLDSSNFVLKEDDYLNYSSNHPLIEAFIKSIFASKVVLFIGYSYNDYNLKQIVQNVRNILGNNFQNAYLLSIDKQAHQSQKLYLKNKGINVIDYYDAKDVDSKGDESSFILEFLKGKNIYKEKFYEEIETLSEKGQLLFNFLRFIRFYDELKTVITDDNLVNQIHDSFNRFSEVKALPQKFISRLYPFKSSTKVEHLIEQTTLLLKNKALVKLFFDEIQIEDKNVIYQPTHSLSETEKKIRQKKLKEIIKKLNNSLIFDVTQENPRADSFGYKGFSKDLKRILLGSEERCQCSRCKFERFEFNDCLADLTSYAITEISDIKEDLQKAYLHYKVGNYRHSFIMHEEIATKAWQMGKYITYYIAKNNIKSLKGLISYNEDNIKEDVRAKIVEKIADIDTDKLIFLIPYKTKEEYELLKIIRDDSVLTEGSNEIEELFKSVKDIYISYKSEYFSSMGAYYPRLIYIELFKILTFYTQNYIVGEGFSNFKNVIQKGVEALILSYATSKRYSGRLEKFSYEFFSITVSHCNSTSLVKFLENHKIKDLKFEEDGIPKILDFCENYFNSFFSTTHILGTNTYKNEGILTQLNKDSFKGKMESIFKNMMILLLSVEIPEGRRENFINSLIEFLKHEKFLYGDSVKYLNRFMEKNPKYFTGEQLVKILKIAHDKIRKHEMYSTIDTIAYIATDNNITLPLDKDYIFKILSDYDYYEPRSKVIISLWEIAIGEEKEKLKNIIIERLNSNFDEELYVIASSEKVIDFNLFFDEYLNYLNRINAQNTPDYTGYSVSNGIPKFNDFSFYNAILFLYNMDIKPTDKRLEKLANLTDYMKFFIFREKSDLENFKLEWLGLVSRKIIYQKLSKSRPIKKIIEDRLKEGFNEEAAKIYTKYFIGYQE